ncbi:hypothetical protein BJ508DRAFT_359827 [Ascobolus immersus RN42]|uniref:Uncharacterized protein n=1 Tax=Ascobolus immersus RN42 TaxID=1160509 RepID=A0A3N4IDA9_ASCIM|nr:hypothetical protein BJ508DRAFT_359827 [Ascobolus immersus RN42]
MTVRFDFQQQRYNFAGTSSYTNESTKATKTWTILDESSDNPPNSSINRRHHQLSSLLALKEEANTDPTNTPETPLRHNGNPHTASGSSLSQYIVVTFVTYILM